jgi:hypothetical protein
VDLQGNIGFLQFLRPLGTPGYRNFPDRSSGNLRRLHGRLSLLHRRFINSYIFSGRSSGSIPLRILIITAKKVKGNRFYTTRREKSKYNKVIEFAEYLRGHEVEKF